MQPYDRKCITDLLHENAKLVVYFINSEVQYNNIKVSTKKNKIQAIITFADFLKKYQHLKNDGYEIPFKQVVKDDFLDFQTSVRKSEEAGLKPFYKYIYYLNEEPKNRKLPDFLVGVNQLHRKEKTTYSANDMWTQEDDQLFLKYCEDPLIRRDFSNRPHELLAVRIGKITEGIDLEGRKYAKVTIGAGGKTKQRPVSFYKSYPDYIEYLQNIILRHQIQIHFYLRTGQPDFNTKMFQLNHPL